MLSAVSTYTALRERTTGTGQFRLGDTTAVFDTTYGPLKATWAYNQDALVTYNCCAPCFEDAAAGYWYVDEDENETNIIGQEWCVGAFLNLAAETAAGYCWVLTAGLNPLIMVTDGSVDAGELIIASTTDGTWNGVPASIAVAATAGTAYSVMGWGVAHARVADVSNALAAGSAFFHSAWSVLPVTV